MASQLESIDFLPYVQDFYMIINAFLDLRVIIDLASSLEIDDHHITS